MKLNPQVSNLTQSPITDLQNKINKKASYIDLNIGEPLFVTPYKVKLATIWSLLTNKTKYASSTGVLKLKKAILLNEEKKSRSYNLNEIIITAGSTSALYLTITSLISEGDEIIVPIPAYPLYQNIINLNKAKLIPYDLTLNNYQLDYQKLTSLITNKTKALIINSPHNPTGTVISKASIACLEKICLNYDLFIIFDNCYEEIYFKEPLPSLNKLLKEKIIICNSFSKAYSMTGWRLGYLLGPAKFIKEALKLHQLMNVSINSFCQLGAALAFHNNLQRKRRKYQKLRDYAYQKLLNLGFEVPYPEGGFYLFPKIPDNFSSSKAFCEALLIKTHLLTTPGEIFQASRHFRICYARKKKVLKKAFLLLEEFIKKQ